LIYRRLYALIDVLGILLALFHKSIHLFETPF
jgi:hypothetical protein